MLRKSQGSSYAVHLSYVPENIIHSFFLIRINFIRIMRLKIGEI